MGITNQILEHIKSVYSAVPEFLWDNDDNAAIRHADTKKWFAVYIKDLPKLKLGLSSNDKTDILNLKCDPIFSYSLIDNKGIFPAFHMNKEHWISVLLDGSVSAEEIYPLIKMSFALTSKPYRGKKSC